MEQKKLKYTYMLKCKDGSLYTGWTTDLDKRVACHNAGKGAKYTRARRPVELVYFEQFQTREEAMRRECEIKKLSRKQKEELIKQKEKHPAY
ncbi:MAG: GIY-YIG nuclease family protein [Blautia sp.]